MSLEVSTADWRMISWVLAPCGLLHRYRRFPGTCYLLKIRTKRFCEKFAPLTSLHDTKTQNIIIIVTMIFTSLLWRTAVDSLQPPGTRGCCSRWISKLITSDSTRWFRWCRSTELGVAVSTLKCCFTSSFGCSGIAATCWVTELSEPTQ
jgi:hypothetical protein